MKEIKELKIGDRAPMFSLRDQKGGLVSLADFNGKKNVVLFFYPGDMTPGCTMQLCAVRDDVTKFSKKDTVVFGINHGDTESHARFIKKHSFPFALLIDTGKKVSEKYGAVKKYFNIKMIRRCVVAIDKEGIIVFLKRGMPKNADILKALT